MNNEQYRAARPPSSWNWKYTVGLSLEKEIPCIIQMCPNLAGEKWFPGNIQKPEQCKTWK